MPRVCPFSRKGFFYFRLFRQLFPQVLSTLILNPLSVCESDVGKCLKMAFLLAGGAVSPISGSAGIFFLFFPESRGKMEPRDVVRDSLGITVTVIKNPVIF